MPIVLVAFDADPAGDKEAKWWLKCLPNARRLRPFLHDINEMLMDNWDIRAWIEQEIEKLEQNDQVTSNEEAYIADVSIGEGLCGACLDIDRNRETSAPYEFEDYMYCAEHHPHCQSFRAFTDTLIAQCPDLALQVQEIYHTSQVTQVKRRALEEYREREIAEQIRMANEAKQRIAAKRRAASD